MVTVDYLLHHIQLHANLYSAHGVQPLHTATTGINYL